MDDLGSTLLEGMVNRQRFTHGEGEANSEGDSPLPYEDLKEINKEAIEDKARVQSPPRSPPQSPPRSPRSPRSPPRSPMAAVPCESEWTKHRVIDSSDQKQHNDSFLEKKQCLIEIRKMRSMGAYFPKMYTFEDDMNAMRQSLEMAKIELIQSNKDMRSKTGVKTARRILLAAVSILEFGTKKWNPLNLHLDGFGEYVMGNLSDYDNIFERLLEKYSGKGTMEPEVELLITLGTSAVMFHVSNKFVERACSSAPVTQAEPEVNRFEDN